MILMQYSKLSMNRIISHFLIQHDGHWNGYWSEKYEGGTLNLFAENCILSMIFNK